jgi:hypothetical protein
VHATQTQRDLAVISKRSHHDENRIHVIAWPGGRPFGCEGHPKIQILFVSLGFNARIAQLRKFDRADIGMKSLAIGAVVYAVLIALTMQGIAAAQASPSNAITPAIAVKPGTALVAELAKSIDAKKAKAGDQVKARIVQDLLAGGRIIIRRGAKLIGHITEARANGQDQPKSVLGIVFDRVTLPAGEEMNFDAVLEALAPPVEKPDVLSTMSSSYGGGDAGGAQPVSHGAARDIATDPRTKIDHTRDDALQSAADPSSYGTSGNMLHNGFLGAGNRGVFGMPGLLLKPGPGAADTELVSSKADIRLETGTQIVVGVTASR